MRKHDMNYVAVGAFVAAMIVAAVLSAALLAGRVGARDSYHTVLDNVADVGFGTLVRYEGYPVGQVEAITPLAEGARMRFRVEVSVDRGWRIPADSVARIGSTSFLAAKTIDIESGQAETAVPRGGEIPGGGPGDVFAAMAGLAGELGDLSRDNLAPLLDRVRHMVETVDKRTPAIVERTASAVERLDQSAAALQDILSGENAAAFNRLVGNAEETSEILVTTGRQLTQTVGKVDHLVGNLDHMMTANRDNLDQSLEDVSYTLAALARSIDTVLHHLEQSSRNMNEFSRLIRQNPGLLLDSTPRQEVSGGYSLTEDPAE